MAPTAHNRRGPRLPSSFNQFFHQVAPPIPPLPPVKCAAAPARLRPLTIGEYERNLRERATDLELVERIYRGGMASNELRAVLWPYLFGMVEQRGRFVRANTSLESSLSNSCGSTSGASSSSASSSASSAASSTSCPASLCMGGPNSARSTPPSSSSYVYVEHEANVLRWRELERLYRSYEQQWEAVKPDQELRFSIFRERKELIKRDVERSDRAHPFYADKPEHQNAFTRLLMTYMMYDFDIGYLQGMSDLAAPILFVYDCEPVKSFWVFVEVMKLFRRNFEQSQKTIHFQLNCLYRLIKLTDPKFANYLKEQESANCFFAFRCIVCQFKRELMRNNASTNSNAAQHHYNIHTSDSNHNQNNHRNPQNHNFTHHCHNHNHNHSNLRHNFNNHTFNHNNIAVDPYDDEFQIDDDDYSKVLNLWDTIWSVQRRHELHAQGSTKSPNAPNNSSSTPHNSYKIVPATRCSLTETEKFVLALCLSLIRRERNLILQQRLDASEIHQHFINPNLARDLDEFIESAYHIFNYLNTDCDLQALVKGASELEPGGACANDGQPPAPAATSASPVTVRAPIDGPQCNGTHKPGCKHNHLQQQQQQQQQQQVVHTNRNANFIQANDYSDNIEAAGADNNDDHDDDDDDIVNTYDLLRDYLIISRRDHLD